MVDGQADGQWYQAPKANKYQYKATWSVKSITEHVNK